jgi:Protein of unknown function (DUF2384)
MGKAMPVPQTQPMSFGVPLDENSPLFFLCLAAAIGLVYLFCRKKFEERSITGNDDFVYQFLPRQLATPQEYSKGFLIYLGTMTFTVLLFSLIGPNNLHAFGIPLPEGISTFVIPLAVALFWVGIMPNVPMLQEVERRLRQYSHERAYIPTAARATAERLSAADFDFSSYGGEALQAPEMSGVEASDFTRSRRALEHDWARLSCLVYELKWRRTADATESLDAGLLRDYERDLESIEEQRKLMAGEVAAYRKEKANNPTYSNDALRQTIRTNLYKLYVLLGCAVRLKQQPHDDIDLALRPFGFKLSQKPSQADNRNVVLVGMTVMAACVLALGFAAVAVGQLHLWTLTLVFPQKWYQPFIDTGTAVVLYGAAIIAADFVRRRSLKKGTWFACAGSRRRAISANYVRVAVVCAIVGYLGSLLWGLAFSGITLGWVKAAAPNGLIAAATGAFYAYYLDNVDLAKRPSRGWEVGWQAAITGICGLIATTASFGILFDDSGLPLPFDQIVLAALTSAAAGAALAWYIPDAAAAAKYDPLAEAKEERARMLEAAALKRFSDPRLATDWLDRPNPALGNKPPRIAAAEVEGYEHAIGLLQGPKPVAA